MNAHTHLRSVKWGVGALDKATQGIPENGISIVETPDYHTGMLLLGHYLYEGLKQGETCALLTFDSPDAFLENFRLWKMDFEQYLTSEQMFLLHYRPNFNFELGLTHQYGAIFDEIRRLCKGKVPTRVAVQQIDTMVNMANLTLMNNSAQKLALAALSESMNGTTVLGQFVQFGDDVHKNLSIVLQKSMSAHFQMRQKDVGARELYGFKTLKLPWYGHLRRELTLELQEGRGFEVVGDVHDKVA